MATPAVARRRDDGDEKDESQFAHGNLLKDTDSYFGAQDGLDNNFLGNLKDCKINGEPVTLDTLKNLPVMVDGEESEGFEDLFEELLEGDNTLLGGLKGKDKRKKKNAIKRVFKQSMLKLKSYNPQMEKVLRGAMKALTSDILDDQLKKLKDEQVKMEAQMAASTSAMGETFKAVAGAHKEFTASILPKLHKGCRLMKDAVNMTNEVNRNSLQLCIDLQGTDGKSGSIDFMKEALKIGERSPDIDKQIVIFKDATAERIKGMIGSCTACANKWSEAQAIFEDQQQAIGNLTQQIEEKKAEMRRQDHEANVALQNYQTAQANLEKELAKVKQNNSFFGNLLNTLGNFIPGVGAILSAATGGKGLGDIIVEITGSGERAKKSSKEIEEGKAEIERQKADQLKRVEDMTECEMMSATFDSCKDGVSKLADISHKQKMVMEQMKEKWIRFDASWTKLNDTIENTMKKHSSEAVKALFKRTNLLENQFDEVNNEVTDIRTFTMAQIKASPALMQSIEDAKQMLDMKK